MFLEILGHLCHLSIDLIDELLDGHDGLFAAALLTHGHSTVGSFFLADNHHVGNALQLIVANLAAEFLVAQVDGSTDALHVELLGNLLGIVVVLL